MWQGIQSVFKKKAKSPDPNKQRMERDLAAQQTNTGPFTLSVQRVQSNPSAQEYKTLTVGQEENKAGADPFAEAMRVAQAEQQMQDSGQFQEREPFSPQQVERGSGNKRLSIGSPLKGLLSLSAKLVRGLSDEPAEESKQSPGQRQAVNSLSPAATGDDDQGMLNQLNREQRIVALLLGGTQKVESLVLGLHGFRINDNPQDREVFVACPQCSLDVFDAGLNHDIQCKKCNFMFTPGQKPNTAALQKTSPQKKTLEQPHVAKSNTQDNDQNNPLRSIESDSGGGLPREVSAFELDDEIKGVTNQEEPLVQISQSVATTVTKNSQQQPPTQQEELHTFYAQQNYEQANECSYSSETDSEEESKLPNYRKRQRKGARGNHKGVAFTADNLIERPGQVLSSLFSSFKIGQNQRQQDQQQAAPSDIDSSSAYVNELESVQIFVMEETVMDDFKEASTKDINYKLILEALLMPFFQLRTRILEKQTYFDIGDIQFFVACTTPHDFGKISTSTRVKLSSAVQKTQSIQRINLVPLRRIDMTKQDLLQNVLKPYFSNNIGTCLFKAQVFEIQEHEFFVKYCRPFFGVISNGTEVKMDSSMPKSVRIVRVAPIWPTKEAFNMASRHSEQTMKLVKSQVLEPYFFGGSMCYLEKGETIKIAGHEFFINECQPRTGIVDETSTIEIEIGFTQETFQKKQVLADQRYAERLQQQMTSTQNASFSFNMIRPSAQLQEQPNEVDYHNLLRDLEASDSTGMNEQQRETQRQHALASFGAGGSSSRRHRRGHSHSATTSLSQVAATETRLHLEYPPNLMQVYGAQAEAFQRQHGHGHMHVNRAGATQHVHQHDLFDIFNHIRRQDGMSIEELQLSEQLSHVMSKATPKAIVDSLPIRIITAEQVTANQALAQTEEAMAKCMVCLIEYEAGEELRTMPCMHFFHRECIDRWLLKRGSTCPICKFNIRQDYNVTSTAQMSSNRRNSERHTGIRPNEFEFY